MFQSPLFGARSPSPLSRPFRTSPLTGAEALIQYDDLWAGFFAALPDEAHLAAVSDKDAIDAYNLPASLFSTTIPRALREWRESPSRSLINMISTIDPQVIPRGAIFPDVVAQTRIIGAALLAEAMSPGAVRTIRGGNGKPLPAFNNSYAATLDVEAWSHINDLARGLMFWELRNRARARCGLVKLPKRLFRGVRSRDVAVNNPPASDNEPWNIRSCRVHLERLKALQAADFTTIAESPLLSFTATETIAEYFTGDEGFVLEVPIADCQIVGGWALDDALAETDPVTGRHEREWIIRLPAGYVLREPQIRSQDRTFAYSTRDPAGVLMLHHETQATYVLEGRKVEAYFSYKASGRGGHVYYRVDGAWSEKRRTVQAKTGFDPVPGPGREPVGLKFFNRSPISQKVQHIAEFKIQTPR